MKSAEEIEQLIENIRVRTDPAVDERILSAADDALAKAKRQPVDGSSSDQPIWKIIIMSNWTKVAAAVAAVIMVIIGIHYYAEDVVPSGSNRLGPAYLPTPEQFGTPENLFPIEIELPTMIFEGTPRNFRYVDRLEKPWGNRIRPEFYVPEETVNIALHKPVTGSDDDPVIGQLDMITDGDKEAADGSFVELGPGPQYITIDLGDSYNIYAVLLWHYHQSARVYYDVIVRIADDPDFTVSVKTLFNNDHDNSAGIGVGRAPHFLEEYQGKFIDAKGEMARYVRLYSNGSTANDTNHYIEVEVYAKPIENKQ